MKALMKRVSIIHDELNDSALAEEYIDGRESTSGSSGTRIPRRCRRSSWISGAARGRPQVLDNKAKWDTEAARQYQGTRSVVATLPDELRARLQKVSVDAYGLFECEITAGRSPAHRYGEIYVLEVNAGCYLAKDSEFAMAAEAAGIDYTNLIKKMSDLACERYKHSGNAIVTGETKIRGTG